MSEIRPLVKSIVPTTIETMMYLEWRQGVPSRELCNAVLSHDLVHAAIERAHAADPQYGHREVNREYVARRISEELQKKDEFGIRVYVSIRLPGRGRRYHPFRSLRLSEITLLIEEKEAEALRHDANLQRLRRFQARLEERPEICEIGDVYDDVVRDLFGRAA